MSKCVYNHFRTPKVCEQKNYITLNKSKVHKNSKITQKVSENLCAKIKYILSACYPNYLFFQPRANVTVEFHLLNVYVVAVVQNARARFGLQCQNFVQISFITPTFLRKDWLRDKET